MKIDKGYSHRININDTTTNILEAKIDILSALVEGKMISFKDVFYL